jgi:neutral ceramidase
VTGNNDDTKAEQAQESGGLTRRSILARGAAGALTASTFGALAAPAFARPSGGAGDGLMVGAGKAEISIPVPVYQAEGFNDIHDPLYARVVLAKTKTNSLVLVVLDLTSIGPPATTDIRTAITNASGVAAEDIVITVTHHFSGPHVGGGAPGSTPTPDEATWVANIVSAATNAVTDAVKGLQKARVGYGVGRCDVNVNRNLLTAQGYFLGANDNGPSDKTVEVARFDDVSGNPIAILTNFSVQSSVMGPNGPPPGSATSGNPALPQEVSADLAGAASNWVEGQYTGAVAPFLCGATGDQQPAFKSLENLIDKNLVMSTQDAGAPGWTLLTVQGQRLGIEIVRVAESITTRPTSALALVTASTNLPTVATVMGEGAPTKSHTWTINGTQALPVWVFRIGDGVFAGTPPELSTPTTLQIRQRSPFQHTFVMGMFEGGNKNMPDIWNYEHFTYASLDGNWAPGDAEQYVRFVGPIIRSLH